MVLITIVIGASKPTYNWGASHCTIINPWFFSHLLRQPVHRGKIPTDGKHVGMTITATAVHQVLVDALSVVRSARNVRYLEMT